MDDRQGLVLDAVLKTLEKRQSITIVEKRGTSTLRIE
jgi:hypothetical protein